MVIKLGSNIASQNAQRRLAEAGNELSKVFERLSSGQRINRASDDAAGLAIADDLKAKSRIYTQAIRNGNDGISLLNIADSAIDTLTAVVVRIRELSEQAANGTYSSKQREAMDNEAQQLSEEFTRISQSTSFNGIKLFTGSLGTGVRLQLGIGTLESINASIGGAVGTGDFGQQTVFTTEGGFSWDMKLGDLNGDGILDLVTAGYDSGVGQINVRLGAGNGTFGNKTLYTTADFTIKAIALADLNNDGILDLATAGEAGGGSMLRIKLGLGDGTFGSTTSFSTSQFTSTGLAVGDLNSDGTLDIVVSGNTAANSGRVSVFMGSGSGDFSRLAVISTEALAINTITLADINDDNNLDFIASGSTSGSGSISIGTGIGNGSFNTASIVTVNEIVAYDVAAADLNSDGILDLVTAGLAASGGTATIRLGLGNSTYASADVYSTELVATRDLELGDLNGDGILDLVTAGYENNSNYDGMVNIRLGLGNGTFAANQTFSSEPGFSTSLAIGDLNGDGVNDLVTAGGTDSPYDGFATVRLAQTKEGLGALLDFSLKTKSEALQAMGLLDRSLQSLAKQRGTIGASQSRINIALDNLQTSKENFNAAESRIRDADVAQESANLIRTQILQQAAASVLSQANQAPALALTLLS